METDANFFLVQVPGNSAEITEELQKQGILIRDGKRFGYDGWLRITVGTPEDNQALLKALEELL